MPCPMDLYRVGKTSPGIMNVVEFGPNPQKKFARQTKTTKPSDEIVLNPKPNIQKITVRIKNPAAWSFLRPIVSTNRTENQYPGTRPASERIILPLPSFWRLFGLIRDHKGRNLSNTVSPGVIPYPIIPRIVEVFKPIPY